MSYMQQRTANKNHRQSELAVYMLLDVYILVVVRMSDVFLKSISGGFLGWLPRITDPVQKLCIVYLSPPHSPPHG